MHNHRRLKIALFTTLFMIGVFFFVGSVANHMWLEAVVWGGALAWMWWGAKDV